MIMKKVYILYNFSNDEAIYASEDRGLLEEIMYDLFLEDAYYDYCHCYHFEYNVPICDIWDDMVEYYNDYMSIIECPMI